MWSLCNSCLWVVAEESADSVELCFLSSAAQGKHGEAVQGEPGLARGQFHSA